MSTYTLPGDPPVQIVLRRSARARRYSLRVSRLDGRVTLTLPSHAPEAKALAFAHEKAPWIRARLAGRLTDVAVDIGACLPVDGQNVTVLHGARTRFDLPAGRIEVGPAVRLVGPAVAGVLREHATARCRAEADAFAAMLGRRYTRLTLRDTRSRWGSCSSQGALMLSWRLILAPRDVLRYVVAHEVAHLAEMNHSPAFWAHVARLWPDYQHQRRWLREQGDSLHRYRFTD